MYVPILKAKAGELRALTELDLTPGADAVQPLVEIVGIDTGDAAEWSPVIERMADRLAKAWPASRGRPIMIDAGLIEPASAYEDEPQRVLGELLNALGRRSVWASPVVHLSDSDEVVNQAREFTRTVRGYGACVRITGEDLDDAVTPLARMVESLVAQLLLSPEEVDLVMDFGTLHDESSLQMATRLSRFILPSLMQLSWRSFTLAAGSFPVNLSEVSAFQLGSVPRLDRQLWRNLDQLNLDRPLHYGDYAVTHPQLQSGTAFAAPPQLRYTRHADWLIIKGRRTDRRGHRQFYDLCSEVLREEGHLAAPPQNSWGDTYIHDAALERVGPGNASTWRAIATSHHIAYVVNELNRVLDR